jgi:DNA polymerase-3 subunit alpha
VNKKVLECLVKAGAFDSLGVARASAMKTVADVLGSGKARNDGQQSIFGEMVADPGQDIPEWDEAELLKNEKEALGFYITGHPLSKFGPLLRRIKARKTPEIESAADKADVLVGGVLRGIKRKNVKSTGDMMAYVSVEDDEGSVEVIVFSELYKSVNPLLKKDALVLVKGNVDKDEKGVRVRAREITALENAGRNGLKKLEISLGDPESCGRRLKEIRSLVVRYPGDCQLYLRIRLNASQALIATGISLNPDNALISTLEDLVGRGGVIVS